ncbi:hypothetical protein PVAP13_2NG107092 [Panicum virgatum]|uniref:Uncharacterized protein n=1 Tax=Panicum virgatum TaxID=38727 RepID=A0A8T0VCS4_PANVG|nr:hypothetical protein PVAP13_2NG107092 [Panicum virgatum]
MGAVTSPVTRNELPLARSGRTIFSRTSLLRRIRTAQPLSARIEQELSGQRRSPAKHGRGTHGDGRGPGASATARAGVPAAVPGPHRPDDAPGRRAPRAGPRRHRPPHALQRAAPHAPPGVLLRRGPRRHARRRRRRGPDHRRHPRHEHRHGGIARARAGRPGVRDARGR